MISSGEFAPDALDAVKLVAGLLRRGQAGEAFRERRRTVSWSASEAGLVSPAVTEERGTAVRLRSGRQALLVARAGDSPDALRLAVREAAQRNGSAPFFKPAQRAKAVASPQAVDPLFGLDAGRLASALAHAIADPRGLTLSLVIAWDSLTRAVVTPKQLLFAGTATTLTAYGTIRREGGTRRFAFQSSRGFAPAVDAFALALAEAVRPAPRFPPRSGLTDVVLSPSAATVFWHETVGHGLEADGGERGSVLSRVMDAVVAPEGIHLHDDPTRADLPGAYRIDDEGVPARPTPLLANGIVVGLLTDKRTARWSPAARGEASQPPHPESSGHGRTSNYRRFPRPRMSNLVVPAGTLPLDDLFAACREGLYVREISSGAANPESGRFALVVDGAEAIRRGRLSGGVSRFTLSGEILTALLNIEPGLGDQAYPATGLGLCVKDGDAVAVGGIAPAMLVRGLNVHSVRA